MTARLRGTAAVAATCALALASTAAGTPQASTPLQSLASMALAPADFQPGAKVELQSTSKSGDQQIYVRRFKAGVRLGSQPLLSAVSEVVLYADAASSTSDFELLQSQLNTKSGRSSFGAAFTRGFLAGSKGKLKVIKTVVGPPVALDAKALGLPVTVKTGIGTLRMVIDLAQVDRVLGIVFLAGLPNRTITAADTARAGAAAEKRITTAFTVANSQAPTISGLAQQGQTLTVDEGSWIGAPSSFSYAWSRCDTSGATCTAIDGATAKTYTLTTADSGFTFRVTVTGANTVNSQQAASSPTAASP
jgi:hypothetical protein